MKKRYKLNLLAALSTLALATLAVAAPNTVTYSYQPHPRTSVTQVEIVYNEQAHGYEVYNTKDGRRFGPIAIDGQKILTAEKVLFMIEMEADSGTTKRLRTQVLALDPKTVLEALDGAQKSLQNMGTRTCGDVFYKTACNAEFQTLMGKFVTVIHNEMKLKPDDTDEVKALVLQSAKKNLVERGHSVSRLSINKDAFSMLLNGKSLELLYQETPTGSGKYKIAKMQENGKTIDCLAFAELCKPDKHSVSDKIDSGKTGPNVGNKDATSTPNQSGLAK